MSKTSEKKKKKKNETILPVQGTWKPLIHSLKTRRKPPAQE
jgi:hypothetical protein